MCRRSEGREECSWGRGGGTGTAGWEKGEGNSRGWDGRTGRGGGGAIGVGPGGEGGQEESGYRGRVAQASSRTRQDLSLISLYVQVSNSKVSLCEQQPNISKLEMERGDGPAGGRGGGGGGGQRGTEEWSTHCPPTAHTSPQKVQGVQGIGGSEGYRGYGAQRG